MSSRRLTARIIVTALVASALALTTLGPATGSQSTPAKKILVTDRRGEAKPDIASLRARSAGTSVKLSIRLRNVKSDTDAITIYVNNSGRGKKPQLAYVTGLTTLGTGYDVWRTRGWKVKYGDPTIDTVDCTDKMRIKRWGRTGRIVKLTIGEQCLGSKGKVRFGVRAERYEPQTSAVIDADWLTGRKRLTPAVKVAR